MAGENNSGENNNGANTGGDGGAGTTTPPAGTTGAGEGANAGTENTEAKFTQEDLNRRDMQGKAEGSRAKEKEILESLGVDDLTAAKEILEKHKEAETAAMTEAQRAEAAAKETEAKATATEAAANRKLRDASVTLGLTRAGITNRDAIEVLLPAVSIDQGDVDDDTKVDEAITSIKEKLPQLFEESDLKPGDKKLPPASNPGGSSRRPENNGISEGERRAKERWPQPTNS